MSLPKRAIGILCKNTIVGIKIIVDATCKLEKVFWLVLITFGFVLISISIVQQITSWTVDPVVTSKAMTTMDKIHAPAITFCSRGSTRFGIAERLANAIDPDKTGYLSKGFNVMKKHFVRKTLENYIFTTKVGEAQYDYPENCYDPVEKVSYVFCKVKS